MSARGMAGTGRIYLSTSNYVGVFGPTIGCNGGVAGICRGRGTLYHLSDTKFKDIADGLSNTFVVVERSSRNGESRWAGVVRGGDRPLLRVVGAASRPQDIKAGSLEAFSSEHQLGAHFAFADQSVRLIAGTIDQSVFAALSTRAGNEAVPDGL